MKNSSMKKNSLIRKWIKDHGNDGFAAFDFKKKTILLYEPLISFDFKKEDLKLYSPFVYVTYKVRSQRKRRKQIYHDDIKANTPACGFWFGSLDETIEYLKNTRDFLKKLGYDTGQCIESNLPDDKIYKDE